MNQFENNFRYLEEYANFCGIEVVKISNGAAMGKGSVKYRLGKNPSQEDLNRLWDLVLPATVAGYSTIYIIYKNNNLINNNKSAKIINIDFKKKERL